MRLYRGFSDYAMTETYEHGTRPLYLKRTYVRYTYFIPEILEQFGKRPRHQNVFCAADVLHCSAPLPPKYAPYPYHGEILTSV